MFSRATANPMEESVTRATDENLTSENWELILAVCDKVDADNEDGARNAVSAISKRLGHRNANVQLFSLSLAEALSKNCGSKVHRELASKSFTQALMRLINDRTTHTKVKSRTAELAKQWSDDFQRDPSLGIMKDTYNAIRAQGVTIAPPPSRPQKKEITEADRRREEEELQIALAMSMNESKISDNHTSSRDNSDARNEADAITNAYTLPQSSSSSRGHNTHGSSSQQNSQAATMQQTPVAERTAATVSRVRALYDFVASEAGELSFRRGDVIQVIESAYKDWWRGSLHGVVGIFPTNYVENLADPTPADIQRELEDEQRVFAEATNVEKLLTILSSAELNDPRFAENEQLQNLYHSTIAIRPKLVRLIEKYAQKKDDLILLNEKFLKARKDYDDLMEASLSRYSTTPYPSGNEAAARQAGYQQSMMSGGNRPYGGSQPYIDPRGQPQGPGAIRQQRMSTGEQYGARSTSANGAYSQIQPQSQPQLQQQRPQQQTFRPQREASGSYTNPHAYASSPGEGPQHSRYPDDGRPSGQAYTSPRPANVRFGSDPRTVADAAQIEPQFSGAYPAQIPTSPSQDLAQAFPPVDKAIRNSSYDHERAEREGGPPIAYYKEHDDAEPHQAASHHETAGNAEIHALAPSAPAYDADQTDDGFADYYRRSE